MAEKKNIRIDGLDEFKRAIRRNPGKTRTEGKKFIARSLAELTRVIIRRPWRVNDAGGGGVPVSTGNLRDTHQKRVVGLRGKIYPTAKYAPFVHGLDGKKFNKRGVRLRPWLDHAVDETKKPIDKLADNMLKNIVKDVMNKYPQFSEILGTFQQLEAVET